MKQRQEDISELLRKLFNVKKFTLLINWERLTENLKDETTNERILNSLNEKSHQILLLLDQLQTCLDIINKIGKNNKYEYEWLFKGKADIAEIFSSLDLLEFNVDLLLDTLDNLSQQKIESILDNLNNICTLILSIKKISYPIKTCLSIINHHIEIEKEVLASVDNEIMFCIEQLEQITEKKNQLKTEEQIANYTFEDFKKKVNELKMLSSREYNGFIVFSTLDGHIFDLYTTLHRSISHISESLNLIPIALEDFHNNAKAYYKDLVLATITKYEHILTKFSEYRKGLKTFKYEYITNRNELICEKIFKLVNINDESISNSTLEDIVNMLRPIENYYGLNEKYSININHIENKINRAKEKENMVQTPLPKSKSSSLYRRSYNNPLSASLLNPVLSDNFKEEDSKIKIFETPRHVDENIFSKSNIDIVERIKFDVQTSIVNKSLIESTPLSEDSFDSLNSSPDTMKVKNIFDSPDPFITPNNRNFNRSKLAILTPSTTPRITPTKKYVMLPTDEEPSTRTANKLINRNMSKPLLQLELSTLVKMESTSDTEYDYDNDISNASSEFIDSPPSKNIPSIVQIDSLFNSPPINRSKIPLPIRPESRLSMLRSVSRLENPHSKFQKKVEIRRPDSRLENLATNLSSRLGTNSPLLSTVNTLKARPATVMAQRRMGATETPAQLRRLKETSVASLNNVGIRGATSLDSRSSFIKSRIASV